VLKNYSLNSLMKMYIRQCAVITPPSYLTYFRCPAERKMMSSTVIFNASNSRSILSVDEIDSEQRLAQARKKRLWLERDSLKRRNQLLVGKEGSRRRQRWDNSKKANEKVYSI
jgi:hypothetical protein